MSKFKLQTDSHMNTGLHLAAENGHLCVVSFLLSYGVDANAKNADNLTALDISCLKCYFEICKILIDQTDVNNLSSYNGQYPMHYAAKYGDHVVVQMLLAKGAQIDKLNSENLNCLDIAIRNRRREVIETLIHDKNWFRLIRTDQKSRFDLDEENVDFNKVVVVSSGKKMVKKLPNENVNTFVDLYNSKMWDAMKLLLDKCKIENKKFNFSLIDSPIKSISESALMLIARSGQEYLVKHDVTLLLAQLKWRLLPRFFFYLNLFLYLVFLILFSLYSIELSYPYEENEATNVFTPNLNEEQLKNNSVIEIGFLKRSFVPHANKNHSMEKKLNLNETQNFFQVNLRKKIIFTILSALFYLNLTKKKKRIFTNQFHFI